MHDKYDIGDRVGNGEFGSVRLATSQADGRMYVIKEVHVSSEGLNYISEEKEVQVILVTYCFSQNLL